LATQESIGRQFAGVLRYVQDHPNIALHEFYDVTPGDEDEESLPPWKGDIEGILLAIGAGPGIVDWVLSGGVPAVNTVSDIIDPRLPAVYAKPESIAQLAVDHLRECGCRRYLHVGSASSMGTQIRAPAFEQAVAATGCPFTHVEVTTKIEEVTPIAYDAIPCAALDRALTAKPYPVGVLTLNDVLGRLVLARAKTLGSTYPGRRPWSASTIPTLRSHNPRR
jgi:LacI family transcriptional regulator